MKKWIKSICFVFVVAAVMSFANQARAVILLPTADFGNGFIWDSNTSTYTDNGIFTNVTSVTFLDGSSQPPPFGGGDSIVFGNVDLTISFDGTQNDTLDIYSFVNPATLLLSANIIVTSTFDPTISSVWSAALDITLLNTGAGSTWINEFASKVDPSDPLAALQLSSFGYTSVNNGVYNINGSGKISPVPEPGTIALLGIGLAGLVGAGVRRRMKMKKNVD